MDISLPLLRPLLRNVENGARAHLIRLIEAIVLALTVRRTRLAVSDLTDAQLRDIGLSNAHTDLAGDAHQRLWRHRLGFAAVQEPIDGSSDTAGRAL